MPQGNKMLHLPDLCNSGLIAISGICGSSPPMNEIHDSLKADLERLNNIPET